MDLGYHPTLRATVRREKLHDTTLPPSPGERKNSPILPWSNAQELEAQLASLALVLPRRA